MNFSVHLTALTPEQRSEVLLTLAGYADERPHEPVATALEVSVRQLQSGVCDAMAVR